MKRIFLTIALIAAAALGCNAQKTSAQTAQSKTAKATATASAQSKTAAAASAQTAKAAASAQTQAQAQKTLDKRDLITREWNTDVATNIKFLDHETIFDSDGRKIQETEYTRLGKLWTKKFEYGPDGKATRELTYNDKGRLDSVQKFEYNEFGRKKTVYTYDARGKLVKIKNIEYSYREHAE